MLLLSIYDLTEAWQTEEIILPLSFDRKDIPFHMVTCPKCIIQCGVPGCLDVIRLSEMVVHNRDNARKHLDIDEQTKAWSLKEVKILLLTIVN